MDNQAKSEELYRLRRTFRYDEFLQSIEPGEVFSLSVIEKMNALHLFLFGLSFPANPKEDTIARINVIKKLIEMKSDINSVDEYGASPLWNAVSCRDINIIPFLLEQGADMRWCPPESGGLCIFACIRELDSPNFPIVKQFMLHGIKLEELSDGKHVTPSEPMVKFYDNILRTRKATILLIGLRQKCPLLKLIGKDCLILIAKTIYQTRGEPVWDQNETSTVPK